MRILHLIDTVGHYGAEKIVLELMQSQNLRGWKTTLGSIGGSAESKRPLEVAAERLGLDVQKFPMAPGLNMSGGRQILQYAGQHEIDLLHSHSYKSNIIIGLQPRNARTMPMLVTLHGWRPAKSILAKCIQRLETFGIYRADLVVAVHETLAADPRLASLPPSRLQVVANGIRPCETISTTSQTDLNALQPRIAEFVRGKLSIVGIGRLSDEKGFDTLLYAVAEMRSKSIDAVVTIFGEGHRRNRIEKLIDKLDLRKSVQLMGYVEAAKHFLPNFDVLVMPSTTEGLPLALLEAMQSGVPIVASRAGGIPAVLEHGQCGRIVPVGDVRLLAEAIEQVRLDLDATADMSMNAQQVVRHRYTAERMAQQYALLYEQLHSSRANVDPVLQSTA